MNARTPIRARLGLPARAWFGPLLLASCVSLAFFLPSTSAADIAPLTPAAYGVSSLCSTPAPGYSSCLGLRLVAREPSSVPGTRTLPAAEPGGSSGSSSEDEGTERANEGTEPAKENTKPFKGSLSPNNLLTAYNLTGATPASAQTIGIVDAYDDTNAEEDLAVFDSQYALPACTSANGCLRKVNEEGNAGPLPPFSKSKTERGWVQEISTDIEVAHGVCPSCHILLVEARTNTNADLYASESTAANLGATEISNSWGGEEPSTDNPVFNHPGIVITASSGDNGYLNWLEEGGARAPDYPASSPHVVAVGGTRLNLSSSAAWEGETVWNDGGVGKEGHKDGHGASGGGCSAFFTAPVWQQSVSGWPTVGCVASRAVADVSADADPYTGVAVYDSTEYEGERGWGVIGGTSVTSPIIASVFALAGGAHGVEYPARTLYENAASAPATLHDVLSGSNAECTSPFKENGTSGCSIAEESEHCGNQARCLAGPGYDGPTGVGSPNGIGAFELPGTYVPPSATTGGPSSVSAPAAAPVSPSAVAQPAVKTPAGTPVPSNTPSSPVVSAISLTRSAKAALNRQRAKLSKVGFAFTLSAATHIRVTISMRIRVHGRLEWKVVSKPITIVAAGGRQSRQLSGKSALAPGRYELTLAPAQGVSRSIIFQVH